MIEKLKKQIALTHNLDEARGVFLSGFDNKGELVVCNGVLTTDKPLQKVIEMLYHGLIQPHEEITTVIADIVLTIEPKYTIEEINTINIAHQGLCIQSIDNSKSGVLLPGTVGVNNISQAFTTIKQKNHIEGNINIYAFSTERIEII